MKIICTKLYEQGDDNPSNIFFSLTEKTQTLSEGEYFEISTLTLNDDQKTEVFEVLEIDEEDVESYLPEVFTYFIDKGVTPDFNTITHTPDEEDVEKENKLNDLLHDLQKHFGGKYSDIPVKGELEETNLKLRIGDHTHNWKNNIGVNYFLCVVVSDSDVTEEKFIDSGMDRVIRIDSSYSLEEGIKEISEGIEDYLFDKGMEKI